MKRVTALQFIVLSFLLWWNGAQGAGLNFSGKHPESLAPGAKYSVKYQRIAADGPYGPHGLFLVNKESGESNLILGFERGADVLWSPDGQLLAVTNWFGSNVSEVFVFKVASRENTDLREVFTTGVPWNCGGEILSEYFEALSWETSSILKFSIHGHRVRDGNEAENFEKKYLYDTSDAAIKALDK